MIEQRNLSPKAKVGWALMRVSTKEQAKVQHGSLEQQRHMLDRWSIQQTEATGNIYRITRHFEEDISGRGKALHKRMALMEIERAIDNKAIDFIVFEKIDRLARDMIYNLGLVKKAQENGVEVHEFESGRIDLRDRGSRLGFNIKNLLAEEYSLDLEEKITKKQREARINNGKDTSTCPTLGLDPHPSKRGMYIINPNEQKILIDIFKKYISCGSVRDLSDYCKKMGYVTKSRLTKEKVDREGNIIPPRKMGGETLEPKALRPLLSHPKIRGYSYFMDTWNQFPKLRDEQGIVKWDYPHGAVVPIDLFEEAQRILSKNKKYNSRLKGTVYLLSGILFHENNAQVTGAGAKTGLYQYYHCPKESLRISKEKIEKIVINRVKEYLANSELLSQIIGESKSLTQIGVPLLEEEVSELRQKVAENKKVVDGFSNYIRQAALKNAESLENVIRTISIERDKAETELTVQERELVHKETRLGELRSQNQEKDMKGYLSETLKNFDELEDFKKRDIIRLIIPRAIVHKANKLELWIRQDLGSKNSRNQNLRDGGSDFGYTNPSYSAAAERGLSADNFLGELSDFSQNDLENPGHFCGGPFSALASSSTVTPEERSSSKVKMAGQARLGRTVASFYQPKSHLVETIDFNHTPLWKSKTFLEEKYVKEGRSIAQIAAETLSSKSAVREALIEFGFKLKGQGKPGLRPAQVPYGYRRLDGLLAPHLGEQRVIQSIRKMSNDGLSYRQICSFLTSVGVPTKNQGKGWQPEMIRRVLTR